MNCDELKMNNDELRQKDTMMESQKDKKPERHKDRKPEREKEGMIKRQNDKKTKKNNGKTNRQKKESLLSLIEFRSFTTNICTNCIK